MYSDVCLNEDIGLESMENDSDRESLQQMILTTSVVMALVCPSCSLANLL